MTEWLVVAETVAIASLGFLACGLLRSHAEILRALDTVTPGRPPGTRPPAPPSPTTVAVDLAGTTPAGGPVTVPVRAVQHDTLLAFLSSECHTCGGFWETLRAGSAAAELPAGTRIVVVARSPGEEGADRIRDLAGEAVPVVMSTEAWVDYQIPVTPYFVHVDGPSGGVVGQGTGTSWAQVASLLRRARAGD